LNNRSPCDIASGAARRINEMAHAVTIPALLRSPSVVADPTAFAHTLLKYVFDTYNNGLDALYFDVLDAMVAEGGPLGPDLSLVVATGIEGTLSYNQCATGEDPESMYGGGAWAKLARRKATLWRAVAQRVAAAETRRLRATLEAEARALQAAALAVAAGASGSSDAATGTPGPGGGALGSSPTGGLPVDRVLLARFHLGALLRANMREEFLAGVAAAADPACTLPGDAVRALKGLAQGTCGVLLPVLKAVPDPLDHGTSGFRERALRATLQLCARVGAEDPEGVRGVMPKGCPGCMWLNLALPVALYPQLEQEAAAAMAACVGDSESGKRIVGHRPWRLRELAADLRGAYTRTQRGGSEPFPFMGNCLDFGGDFGTDPTSINNRLGALLVCPPLRRRLGADPAAAVADVTRYLRDKKISLQSLWPDAGGRETTDGDGVASFA
jgi:hypothetical protein